MLLSTENKKKARDWKGTVCDWDLYGDHGVYGGDDGAMCALV